MRCNAVKPCSYPPYARLARLIIDSPDAIRAEAASRWLGAVLQRHMPLPTCNPVRTRRGSDSQDQGSPSLAYAAESGLEPDLTSMAEGHTRRDAPGARPAAGCENQCGY